MFNNGIESSWQHFVYFKLYFYTVGAVSEKCLSDSFVTANSFDWPCLVLYKGF